jgi:hypothetical protein
MVTGSVYEFRRDLASMNALSILFLAQSTGVTGTSRPIVPTLIVAAIALVAPLVLRWYVNTAARRFKFVLNVVLLIGAATVLLRFVTGFNALPYPPRSLRYDLSLTFQLVLPLIVVVASSIELWRLSRQAARNTEQRIEADSFRSS